MKFEKRNSINDKTKKYCHLRDEHSFIEITEWTNGEGFDVTIDERMFNLTYGELDAIVFLSKALQWEDENE